jgi:hypothetical protein
LAQPSVLHWPFWLGGSPSLKNYLSFSTWPQNQQPDQIK